MGQLLLETSLMMSNDEIAESVSNVPGDMTLVNPLKTLQQMLAVSANNTNVTSVTVFSPQNSGCGIESPASFWDHHVSGQVQSHRHALAEDDWKWELKSRRMNPEQTLEESNRNWDCDASEQRWTKNLKRRRRKWNSPRWNAKTNCHWFEKMRLWTKHLQRLVFPALVGLFVCGLGKLDPGWIQR